MRYLKISKGGQISVPATVRHRWQTSTVAVEDLGDQLVVKPAPDDPIDSVVGIFKKEFGAAGASLAEIRADLRREEAEIEERKFRRYNGS